MNDYPYPNYNFGERLDGSLKGPGFAYIEFPDGFASEYSAGPGDDIYPGLYPTIYEGITPWDLETIRRDMTYGYQRKLPDGSWQFLGNDPLMQEVRERAQEQALVRAMQGKPPFWTPEDAYTGIPYQGRYRPQSLY